MKTVRLLHCADLHIDSPFRGLSEVHQDLWDILYQATYQSFNNIVELAIKEAVDCVLVSGDIYDGADKSLQAQIKFRNGLQCLSEAGIPSFVIYGNHDPLDSWSASLEWPDNVRIFSGAEVEHFPLEKDGEVLAHIYGISFSKRDVYDNLALKFEKVEEDGVFSIGLLHTNIGENTGHEPYAPCSIEDLSSKGMDYWALGHIHNHKILKDSNPTIVYSGNSQARNPRETGEKGCCLVTLYPNGEAEIQFRVTDVVRYNSTSLDISDCANLDEVISAVRDRCEEISGEMNGRHAIIRLSLTGRSVLHQELQKGNNINDLLEQVREYFENGDPWIWIETLNLKTVGTYEIDRLRKGIDFVADIISLYDELENDENEYIGNIKTALEPLFTTWQGQKYLDEISDEELKEISVEARNWILDKLVRDE